MLPLWLAMQEMQPIALLIHMANLKLERFMQEKSHGPDMSTSRMFTSNQCNCTISIACNDLPPTCIICVMH